MQLIKKKIRNKSKQGKPSSERANPLVATRIEADMVVATGGTAQEHTVWVERGGGERSGLVAQEARVRLNAGDFVSIKVKDLDKMRRGAPVQQPVSF